MAQRQRRSTAKAGARAGTAGARAVAAGMDERRRTRKRPLPPEVDAGGVQR
jgi:hypothetical protein